MQLIISLRIIHRGDQSCEFMLSQSCANVMQLNLPHFVLR